ncbi:MAG: phosphomannomutase/phosphoglucomutase [Bacteroidetes bacterium]|nr:phosphomannomutase/phosphoglucomutase [Bacteroidota bacterium]
MKAFHAYDIRGIYDVEFDRNDVYRIGYFIPVLLKTNRVLVGRDVRVSSDEIFEYLCRGINDSGADVWNLGLSTTPMVYYYTAKHGFDASVMITASHNSKEYNGMKISATGALPVGYDTGLKELERMMNEEPVVVSKEKGRIIDFDDHTDYLDFLKGYSPDLTGMRIAVDCSNGMAGLLIKKILGDSPVYIYDDLDGTFPNHEANPLIQENVEDLKKMVTQEKCDIGIIFDGDADRVMFVDEKGRFISPDLMIAVIGHYFLDKLKGNVLQDIRTSKAVGEYIQKMGGTMHTWRVGRAFAALKLREIDGIFGGELAGHYYFRDFYYSDSGMLACLIILEVVSRMKKKGIKVSEMIAGITSYANSGEINFRISEKKEAMDELKDYFSQTESPSAFYDFDGYRLEFKDWWFNIRPSNTEPYLRFLAEASSEELLKSKVAEVRRIISRFD